MELSVKEKVKLVVRSIRIVPEEGTNIIIGRSHFIKSVEDIYEAIVNTVPTMKFGLAFSEASGKRLIRHTGNDTKLEEDAIKIIETLKSGHTFALIIKNGYPINIMERLKHVPEVVELYCATANPLEILVADGENGGCIIGIIDGYSPVGVEKEEDIKERKEFLRKIGYKQ